MRKVPHLFIVSVVILFLHGCTLSSSEDLRDYENKLRYFDKIYCNHFPADKEDLLVGSRQIIDTFANHNTESFIFQLNKNSSEKEIDRIEEKYQSFQKYNAKDSIFITINDFLTIKNLTDELDTQKSRYSKTLENKLIPLPNFWSLEYENVDTLFKLSKDFEIIPLNTQTGMFSKKIDPSKSSMPPSLLHGRSKGIAYSKKEKTVIYWVIFW